MPIPAIVGTVLTVGGKLLGGLLSKKPKAPRRVTPLQLRNEAEQAGFNPLTVLRGAGGGGFGFNPAEPVPAMSSMQVVANALGGVGEAISRFDPMAGETAKQERELIGEQIKIARANRIKAEREADSQSERARAEIEPLRERSIGKGRSVSIVSTSPKRKGTPKPVPVPSVAANEAANLKKPLNNGAVPTSKVPLGFTKMTLDPDPLVAAGTGEPVRAKLGPNAISLPTFEENYGEIGEFIGGAWNLGDYAAYWVGKKLANAIDDRRRTIETRKLEKYFRGKGPKPSWYDGPAKPKAERFK